MNVLDGVSPELTTRWSALLHDIGKPEAKTVDEKTGYFHFYKHENYWSFHCKTNYV